MAEIISETREFVLGTDGVTYFEVYTVTYDNEEQTVDKTLVGPADQLANHYADKFQQIASTLAGNVQPAAQAKKTINEINGDATDIQTITGIDPLGIVQARYEAELLTPGWTIDDGTGGLPIVFTINAQGNLRYNVNGTGTKGATIYGSVLRLNNYPVAPTNVDFFITENKRRFFSLPDRNVIIKKP